MFFLPRLSVSQLRCIVRLVLTAYLYNLTGEAITAWLGEAIKATPELANLTAPNGRSVTDVAEQARLSRADANALWAIRSKKTTYAEN